MTAKSKMIRALLEWFGSLLSTSMFYKRAAQRIELFWKDVYPADNEQNRVRNTQWLRALRTLVSFVQKVTVELSVRADKELKDGDQIPIQFIVRFAGTYIIIFLAYNLIILPRKERGQPTRLYKGHSSHCKRPDRLKWPFKALWLYKRHARKRRVSFFYIVYILIKNLQIFFYGQHKRTLWTAWLHQCSIWNILGQCATAYLGPIQGVLPTEGGVPIQGEK